jgi:hypothetical protein
MINKITEYEMLVFMRYDEGFNNLASKNLQKVSSSKSSLLASGISANKF